MASLSLSAPFLPRSLSLTTISTGRLSLLCASRLRRRFLPSICCKNELPSCDNANREHIVSQIFPTAATLGNETAIDSRLLQNWQKAIAMSLGASSLMITLPANALVTPEMVPDILDAIFLSVVTAILYLIVAPLGIYYYLHKRWFKRKMAEAIFQFWLVFTFFPGMLLLAPFINLRGAPKEGAKEPWDEIRPSL
ncbi:hypothetical protein KP509_13G073600 [Ceratopteris richardii]|uniref:Uncharacterized protein n=2 Tax=Ceratopteris richardii TaxID=49495 RepID=A0A8T2TGL7_CERRI|nr:hypothetical protein KP509_13G073600 [Ceratopteris richardii]